MFMPVTILVSAACLLIHAARSRSGDHAGLTKVNRIATRDEIGVLRQAKRQQPALIKFRPASMSRHMNKRVFISIIVNRLHGYSDVTPA
jgi:hypothetical protein